MFIVKWKDAADNCLEREFDNLGPAMDWAKTLSVFVVIAGKDFELVGKFGVDSVENGVCPDGVEYSWKKRRK